MSAHAQSRLFDGDFESGTLIGWVPGKKGSAILAAKNRCFSSQDSTAVNIRGRYAGLLRGTDKLEAGVSASLTSKPFTAGKGLLFLALTEQHPDSDTLASPYALIVSLLNTDGMTLSTHTIDTARIALSPGCPSLPRDQRFSEHFVSTQKYLGETIKLRFSQHPTLARSQNFTLIDQVSVIQQGELAAYSANPVAIAGVAYDHQLNALYLVAKIPQHAITESRNWSYSWQIDEDVEPRSSYKTCISDLKPGNHIANLSVRTATALETDTIRFYVPERGKRPKNEEPGRLACKPEQRKAPHQATQPKPALSTLPSMSTADQ